jgi:hypothetical protein
MNKPAHLFVSSSDGHLYDTRKPEWHKGEPLRKDYARTFRTIRNTAQLKATLRAGPYAWPGGYPIVLITNDGEMVSPAALAKDRGQLQWAIRSIRDRGGDRIIGADVYWEGEPVECAATGVMIESAYGVAEGAEE